MARKMSRELRIDLEMAVASYKADFPYSSEEMLQAALGYKTNHDGTELKEAPSEG